MGDLNLVPGLGRSPGEGKGYSLQYSGLENSMDYTAHGLTKSQTPLSDFHFHFPGDLYTHLEKFERHCLRVNAPQNTRFWFEGPAAQCSYYLDVYPKKMRQIYDPILRSDYLQMISFSKGSKCTKEKQT